MMTDCSHQAVSISERRRLDAHSALDGFAVRMRHRVRQAFCGLRGHDHMLRLEHDRLFLKCATCSHESPGWELTEAPPQVRWGGDARRHVLARPHLVNTRRIA
jgi:hypothetical protein